MSEPYIPEPPPDNEGENRGDIPRCPHCGLILRRQGIDLWLCPDHHIVRPYYGNPREDEER